MISHKITQFSLTFICTWHWEGERLCLAGVRCFIAILYHFTATSCSYVNNAKKWEVLVQCEGGPEPVPPRRLVFPSHSAETDKFFNLHCLVDPLPEVTLVCSCDLFSARRDIFLWWKTGTLCSQSLIRRESNQTMTVSRPTTRGHTISCLADTQRCTHRHAHTHTRQHACMHSDSATQSKPTHTPKNKYSEENNETTLKFSHESNHHGFNQKTACRQTVTESLPLHLERDIAQSWNQNNHQPQSSTEVAPSRYWVQLATEKKGERTVFLYLWYGFL